MGYPQHLKPHQLQLGVPSDPRNLEIQESGNLGIWNPKKFQKMKTDRIKIRSAQNVDKVLISRKETFRPYLGSFSTMFPVAGKVQQLYIFFAYFPWWSNRVLFTRFGVMRRCHFAYLSAL